MTAFLRANPASLTPPPRLTVSSAVSPVSAQSTADEGGGVADAHLADAEDLHAVVLGAARGADAGVDRRQRLFARHRRLDGEVLRAHGDLFVAHAGKGEVGVDAEVDHVDLGAAVAREHADAGQPAGDVDCLRQRHRLRRRGDALRDDAVVRSEHQHAAAVGAVVELAGDAGDLHADVLEPAQASGRLGKAQLAFAGSRHGALVRRGNGGKGFIEQFIHGVSLVLGGRSARVNSRLL